MSTENVNKIILFKEYAQSRYIGYFRDLLKQGMAFAITITHF